MKPIITLLLALTPVCLLAGEPVAVPLRGKPQSIAVFSGAGARKGPVLFLPGDGGWRGMAVSMAEKIAGWGYDVYGFDTKKYLETSAPLTTDTMRQDMDTLLTWVHSRGNGKIIVLGWSEGAGMAILGAAGASPNLVRGVVTMGLPESAVLRWTWQDAIVSAAVEPNEPRFAVEPLLSKLGTPLWMIYGTADEYTPQARANRMYQRATQPKRLVTVAGADHRFDFHKPEMYSALEEGFKWISYDATVASR